MCTINGLCLSRFALPSLWRVLGVWKMYTRALALVEIWFNAAAGMSGHLPISDELQTGYLSEKDSGGRETWLRCEEKVWKDGLRSLDTDVILELIYLFILVNSRFGFGRVIEDFITTLDETNDESALGESEEDFISGLDDTDNLAFGGSSKMRLLS
ncbi:hypothetical protein EDB19DRAFT_1828402 [Suillus lakei]|nr:hypothetical protein EDB19DRAFT_1828402 [Suillus lakei]